MAKRIVLVVLAGLLALGMCACGSQDGGVSVQRADELAAAGLAEDRYVGMVVSDNVVEIQRDSSKTIEELYVTVGQKVQAGDKLFTYDSDALELDLEKAQLEVEKMTNEQADYAEQLEKLEKQLKNTYNDSTKVRLTLEINTLKTEQMENDYNMASKNKEIENLKEMLENIDITTPVEGTVRKIDEQGESGAYITIQQSGAYRIKGMVNEMSIGSGIMEGARVKVFSRVDSTKVWMGTVAYIDLEDASQNNTDYWSSGSSDTMTTSSSYPFYVDLDSTEDLLLGQHVYMEVAAEEELTGLWVPENYLVDMGFNEETGEMTASVWADNGHGRLEKRNVSLGMYDGTTGSYEILSGLAAEDYVADPAAPGCESGASTIRREPQDFGGTTEQTVPVETILETMAGETIVATVTEEAVEETAAEESAAEPTGETAG